MSTRSGFATALAIAGLFGTAAVVALPQTASAATITVAPSLVAIAPGDGCSLLEAIINANDDAATHPDCAAGAGVDTIVLASGSTYTLTSAHNSSDGANGTPVITGGLTIEGNGATIRRDPASATPAFRLLRIASGDVTISGVTLRNGGLLDSGGALLTTTPGTVTITGSTLTGNFAAAGGAIGINGGTLRIIRSTLSGNEAATEGGAIDIAGGAATTVLITGSTLSGNQAAQTGGAASLTNASITNSTFSGNSAFGTGALVIAPGSTAGITSSTFVHGSGTAVLGLPTGTSVQRSVIATGGATCNVAAGVIDASNQASSTCGSAATVNLALGALSDNGGPTKTHALLAGSSSIDAATGPCPPTDQRGVTRPQGAACDIGAFEYAPPTPAPGPEFSRVQGADRFATAAAVSAATFSPGVHTVFVATGDDYADGLTAGAIAGSLRAPVLLVRRDSIPAATATELARLAAQRIVAVGGTAVIADGVLTALDAFTTGPVTRIFGPNRYATAAALSATYITPGVDEVYIATGANFADALTAAAAAGANDAPVLLVTPTSIPAATSAELTRLAPGRITVVGGPAAISASVVTALGPFAGTVTRVFGPDRYATAAAVSAHAFTTAATVHLATGLAFADALAAGPAAAMAPGPILLARTTCIPTATDTEIARLGATRVVILGGTAALAPPIADGTTCT